MQTVVLEDVEDGLMRTSKYNYKFIIKIITITTLVLVIVAFIGLFVVVPLVFMYSFNFQQALMFTRFGLPTSPKDFQLDLPGVRNLYVPVDDSASNKLISLGVWHMLPWAIVNSTQGTDFDFDNLLASSDYNVLIHFHGTGETRRDSYRMSVILRNFFHVFLFDYRSYGDSTRGLMTEQAVVDDCVQFYKWVMSRTNAKIYVWGHSLGASIVLNTMRLLRREGISPAGLFLEAAFTSMWEEIPYHPYGKIFAWLPYFDATIRIPLTKNGFYFDNMEYMQETSMPVMVFHAEDDSIIPLELGKKLYSAIVTPDRNKAFIKVPKSYGCDHFWLYIYPELPYLIEQFLFITKRQDEKRTQHNDVKILFRR